MANLLQGIALLLTITSLGYLLSKVISPNLEILEKISLAYPLGSGILSWLLFIMSWIGIPISQLSVFLLILIIFAISFFLISVQQKDFHRKFDLSWIPGILKQNILNSDNLFRLIFGSIMISAFILSIGRSYGDAFDGIAIWSVKGYGIANGGSIYSGRNWGLWELSYPLNIMLQISIYYLFEGDILPASKLLFPMYLLSLSLACFIYFRKIGVNKYISWFGILLVITNPVVNIQSTNGYTNLPFTSLIVLSIIYGIETGFHQVQRNNILLGLLLGIVVWTRPEGLAYSLVILFGFFVLSKLIRDVKYSPGYLLAPLITIAGTWFAFYWVNSSGSQFGERVASLTSALFETDLNMGNLLLIPRLFLKRALEPDNWGVFIPSVFILFFSGTFLTKPWRKQKNIAFLIMTVLIVLIPFVIYAIVSFNPFDDFELILRRDFDRAFLPGFVMLTMLSTRFWATSE